MALGCANQTISGLAAGSNLTKEEIEYRASRKAMADMFMDGVLKRLHVVHMEMSQQQHSVFSLSRKPLLMLYYHS
jgi:hypothetical protein